MKLIVRIICLLNVLAIAAIFPVAAAALESSPTTYDFGQVDIQDSAPHMTWTVSSNYPGINNNLGSISVPAGFSISNNACMGGSLSFGGSCTAKFAPINTLANLGQIQGSASVSSVFDASASLLLKVQVTRRVLSLDPGSNLDLGAIALGGADKHSKVELTNSGTGVVTIDSLGMIGDVATLSANVSGCVGAQLGPNEKCSMPVTFHAANAGSFSTGISVLSNDAAFSGPIQLSGSVSAPVGSLAPAALDYGSRAVGSGQSPLQVATISNSGLVDLALGQPSLEGPGSSAFTVAFSTCPAVLMPGAECKLALAFDPPAVGAWNAALALPTSDPGGSKQLALGGIGVASGSGAGLQSGLNARFTGSTHLARATRLNYRFSCPLNSCIVAGSIKLTPSRGRPLKLSGSTAGALAGAHGKMIFELGKSQRRLIARWLRAKRKVKAVATLTDRTPGRELSVVVRKSLRR